MITSEAAISVGRRRAPASERRVVIAGLGSIGRRHLTNLQSLGVGNIVVQTTRVDHAQAHTSGLVVGDLREALDTQPDVVLVCTPTSCHVPVALAAARAGAQLFVEKPLSHSMSGVRELAGVVGDRRLMAMVGFDLRFDPGLRRVKALIESGSIGRVLSLQAQVGQYLPDWRPDQDYRTSYSAQASRGGGVVLDLIHELDYVTWLAGPVSEVGCLAGHVSELEIDTEDVAAIVLRFESGAIGTVHLDYLQRVPTRSCRIIGQAGTIEWDYQAQSVRTFLPGAGAADTFVYHPFTRNDRFVAEMKHLLACLDGDEVPQCDLPTAERSLALALAAKTAADSQRVCAVS